MSKVNAARFAGEVLRRLIKENFPSQEEFAFEFGTDIRTVSRYINKGITKVTTIQELAEYFSISIKEFFPE